MKTLNNNNNKNRGRLGLLKSPPPPQTPTNRGREMDLTKYQTGVYAIHDKIAGQLTGGLYCHKHDAAAVRFYSDVAAMKDSNIGRHPQDYDLVRLGYVTHHNELVPDHTLILEGSMWAAAQQEALNNHVHEYGDAK